MTANMHGLLHLPDTVRRLGPLWVHSCFPFEAANGVILELFHGTQSSEKQVQIIAVVFMHALCWFIGCESH